MLLLAPPPPQNVARAWAHPGTDNGGVAGGAASAAAGGDADESPKVCRAVQRACSCLSAHVVSQRKRRSR